MSDLINKNNNVSFFSKKSLIKNNKEEHLCDDPTPFGLTLQEPYPENVKLVPNQEMSCYQSITGTPTGSDTYMDFDYPL